MSHTLRIHPRLLLSIVGALALLALPTIARAATVYDDCRLCKDVPQTGLTSNSYCAYPESGGNGYLGCSERWIVFGMLCIDGRTDCIYVCIGPGCPDSGLGGGGSSNGGGGGGGCDTSFGSCPADCFDCGGAYY